MEVDLSPEALHRVSRLLELRQQRATYALCGPDSTETQIRETAEFVYHVRDALDALEEPQESPLRVRAIAEQLLERLPKPPSTLDPLPATKIVDAATSLRGPVAGPDQAPPRPAVPALVSRTTIYENVLLLEGKLRDAVAKASGCDQECTTYVIRNCGRALAPPVEERVPATGGIAWTARPLRDSGNETVRGDPTRATWLFRKFDRMCRETATKYAAGPSDVFPDACRVAADFGRQTESFPGVLFAAAIRSDLEWMPSKLGSPSTARLDQALLTVMRRVRRGDTPLALLTGLTQTLAAPQGKLENTVLRAARLISYMGDVLSLDSLSDLERALPILSGQLVAYWPTLEPHSPALDAGNVSRVAREVYVLNQLGLASDDDHERDASEVGYRLLSAMLHTLEVAVEAVGVSDLEGWKRTLGAARAGALMLAGRYPEGALAMTRPEVYQGRVARSVNAILPVAVSVATQQTPTGVASALYAGAERITIQDLRAERVQFSFSGQFGIAGTVDLPSGAGEGVGHAYVLGLTLPVGVGLSIPAKGTYVSLQLTMLDIAQLAAIPLAKSTGKTRRFGQDVDAVPVPTTKIRPEQALAPGLFFGVAWPKTAILLAGGVSVAPRLREYEFRNREGRRLDADQVTVMRIGAKMVVDLPFLEFF